MSLSPERMNKLTDISAALLLTVASLAGAGAVGSEASTLKHEGAATALADVGHPVEAAHAELQASDAEQTRNSLLEVTVVTGLIGASGVVKAISRRRSRRN